MKEEVKRGRIDSLLLNLHRLRIVSVLERGSLLHFNSLKRFKHMGNIIESFPLIGQERRTRDVVQYSTDVHVHTCTRTLFY